MLCPHGFEHWCVKCDSDPTDTTDWDREEKFQWWVTSPLREDWR